MSNESLFETSVDSVETVFPGLICDVPVIESAPVDQIKLKMRRQDGLIYLLSGTVDKKKQLLASAQEMINELTGELQRKDAVVQQLKDEINVLKTDKRGNSGKIHLLQYQLNKNKKSPPPKVIPDIEVSTSQPVLTSTTPSSPLTNRQAWLLHWRKSQGYRQSLSTKEADVSTNTSFCVEALDVERSFDVVVDIKEPHVPIIDIDTSILGLIEANNIVDSNEAEILSPVKVEQQLNTTFGASVDMSLLEYKLKEYVDAQLQLRLQSAAETLNTTTATAVSMEAKTPASTNNVADKSELISPISVSLNNSNALSTNKKSILSNTTITPINRASDKKSVRMDTIATGGKSESRVHFSYFNEEQSASPVSNNSQSIHTVASTSTIEYNDSTIINRSLNTSKNTVRSSKSKLSSTPSNDCSMSTVTIDGTLNLTEIMNTSTVSPNIIRSLFNGFLAEENTTKPNSTSALNKSANKSVNKSTTNTPVNISMKSDKKNKSVRLSSNKSIHQESLETIQLTPEKKGTNRNTSLMCSIPSENVTFNSQQASFARVSLSPISSPLRPTGFNFNDSMHTVAVVDEDDDDNDILSCHSLTSCDDSSICSVNTDSKSYSKLLKTPVFQNDYSKSSKKTGEKRVILLDITNNSSIISESRKKNVSSFASPVSEVSRLSTKDIISCLSGNRKQTSNSATAVVTLQRAMMSPVRSKVVQELVPSPVVASTPPSKVLQFLKAQAKKMNNNTVVEPVSVEVESVEKFEPISPVKEVMASKPTTELPQSKSVVPESISELHAFYQQQLQQQQQNMMDFFMQQLQHQRLNVSAPLVAANNVNNYSALTDMQPSAPVEVVPVVASVPLREVPERTSRNENASTFLSPDSFKDHMSKFRRENDRMRSDIHRFKENIERMKDECKPSRPKPQPQVVPMVNDSVSRKYSVAASYSSVYV